jgi:hypothetical protein
MDEVRVQYYCWIRIISYKRWNDDIGINPKGMLFLIEAILD